METLLRPMPGKILIDPAVEEAVTASGLLIPDASKEKSVTGKVIATGKGSDFQAGQTVLYQKYSGHEIPNGDQIMLLMDEADLLAVVES